MPTVGSLFSGIGGMDLGLERAGWTVRWQVEWDEWCQRVLAKHWPDVPRYGDITAVDWTTVEPVDLLAGGFPCQPFSLAGQRRGKSDDRWLWPAFADAIRHLRPSFVLVENVPGLLAGHGGMGTVLGDLAELGYDARWDSIPAAAVGAPHLRYRVWIIAHARRDEHEIGPSSLGWPATPHLLANDDRGHGGAGSQGRPVHAERANQWPFGPGSMGDTASGGRNGASAEEAREHRRQRAEPFGGSGRALGAANWWSVEPDVGRVAHGVPSRVDRLRGLGNAVVPQVVEVIGRQLLASIEAAA